MKTIISALKETIHFLLGLHKWNYIKPNYFNPYKRECTICGKIQYRQFLPTENSPIIKWIDE